MPTVSMKKKESNVCVCVCPLCHFFAFNNSQHKSKSMSYIMKGNGGLAVKNLFRLNDLFKQFKKRERSVCERTDNSG